MASLKGELPAPTFRILLSYLMYCEMISLRFAQFLYQSNSVQFLLRRKLLSVTFLPERLFAVMTVLLKIHADLNYKFY